MIMTEKGFDQNAVDEFAEQFDKALDAAIRHSEEEKKNGKGHPMKQLKVIQVKGGQGSGNFGHEGRPGEIGGSGSGGGTDVTSRTRTEGRMNITEAVHGTKHPRAIYNPMLPTSGANNQNQVEPHVRLGEFVHPVTNETWVEVSPVGGDTYAFRNNLKHSGYSWDGDVWTLRIPSNDKERMGKELGRLVSNITGMKRLIVPPGTPLDKDPHPLWKEWNKDRNGVESPIAEQPPKRISEVPMKQLRIFGKAFRNSSIMATGEPEKFLIVSGMKPYKHEHAARQTEPSRYRKFARQNDKFGQGIHAIWGITKDGGTELQSIRFDSEKFTVEEARRWLKDHGMKTEIEKASKAAEQKKIVSPNPDAMLGKAVSFSVPGSPHRIVGLCRKMLDGNLASIELTIPDAQGVLRRIGQEVAVDRKDLEDVSVVVADKPLLVKVWEATVPFEAKKVDVRADPVNEKSRVVDYQDVVIDGYLSTFVGTTPKDRDGDYVLPEAFNKTLEKFKDNAVMLLDHKNSTATIAGSYTHLSVDNKGLRVQGKLSNAPGLVDTRFKVVEGHLRCLSMGGLFHYKEDGKGIEQVDLFEGSLVAVPANQDALFQVRNFTAIDAAKAYGRV